LEAARTAPTTIARLLTRYLKEVTPTKGTSKQDHDRRAVRIFSMLFGGKAPKELDRSDWDGFVRLRRTGGIPGFGAVRERQISYDLKFMVAVLTWATGLQDSGRPVLEFNPWGAERRKAHRMLMPKEQSPKRPAMTDEIRAVLIDYSPHWQFELALILGRYTISRNSSVRHLRWSDVDLEAGTVRWRGEHDKTGREVVVPLAEEAIEALRRAPRGIGDVWVFPSATGPSQPTPRNTFQTWMRRAKKRAGITIRGLGFHGEKRAGVRDSWFRSLDPKMKEKLARTNHRTLVDVYDDVDLEEMRAAMLRRKAT
jgi:integrase